MSVAVPDRAWKLIADESRWCQNKPAIDSTGKASDVDAPEACRWCAWGALMFIYKRGCTASLIIEAYWAEYHTSMPDDNDHPGMTAAKMSARLRVVEEQFLAQQEATL